MEARFANIDTPAASRLCHPLKVEVVEKDEAATVAAPESRRCCSLSTGIGGNWVEVVGASHQIRVQTGAAARENTWRASAASRGTAAGGPTAGSSVIC